MLRKLSACLTAATIILSVLTGCASGAETAKSEYPETWAYLKNTYGEYISVDEDGDFTWNFGDDAATKLLPEGNYDIYSGYDYFLHVMDVENSEEIGYAVRYLIQNTPTPGRRLYIHDKMPKLQVYLDKRWWTIETQPQPGSDIGVWITDYSTYVFLNSMLARGTEEYLPEGRYRIIVDLNPEYDAVIGSEFYNEPDKENLSEASESVQNMKTLYPETWQTLRSVYGDFICIDGGGDFAWNFNAQDKEELLPEDEYSLYGGGDLNLEYTGITYDYDKKAEFMFTNNTGKAIDIHNKEVYILQIYLDGKWWSLLTKNESTNDWSKWTVVSPGANTITNTITKSLLANTTLKPLPDGHYRLITNLNPTYNSYIAVEFDCFE